MSGQHIYAPGPVDLHESVTRGGFRVLHHRSREFISVHDQVRRDVAALFPTSAGLVLLPGSATYSLEAAVQSFLPQGADVLVLTNGAYGDRLDALARARGCEVETRTADSMRSLDTRATRQLIVERRPYAVLVVRGETSTGVLNDLSGIVAAAGQTGSLLIIDEVSTLGAEQPLPLTAEQPWVCVATSGKAVEALPGVGIVTASAPAWSRARPSGFSLDLVAHREAQEAGTLRFTPSVQAVCSMLPALERLRTEGVAARAERYSAELARYRSALAGRGFEAPVPPAHNSSTILLLRVPATLDARRLRSSLEERGIVVYAGLGDDDPLHIRVSSMGAHTPHRAPRLLDAVEQVLR